MEVPWRLNHCLKRIEHDRTKRRPNSESDRHTCKLINGLFECHVITSLFWFLLIYQDTLVPYTSLSKKEKKTFLNTEWLFALSRFDLLNSPCEEVTNFFAESKTIMLLGFLCTVESCIVSGRGWSQTSCGVSRAPSIPVTLPVIPVTLSSSDFETCSGIRACVCEYYVD